MSKICCTIHQLFNKVNKHSFPFKKEDIPLNGIYILFEQREFAHSTKRIVRVGTHTGDNQLPSRLFQHFVNENKDRSIFRKNIGRALLNENKNSFIQQWELDLTSTKAKEKYSNFVDFKKQEEIEKKVTSYIQNNFSFVAFSIDNKQERLKLESKIISTLSLCNECLPSAKWLGLFSPKPKIKNSGLWLVNELDKESLSSKDLIRLKKIIDDSRNS